MKRTFKVFAPKWIYKLAFTGFLICVLIPGLVCLIDDGSMVGTIVSAVLFSPFLVGALCGYRFRIIVCQDTITVRRGIGKGYSFHVNEITKVVRRVNRNTNLGTLVKVTIYTKSRHVSVETLYENEVQFDIRWYFISVCSTLDFVNFGLLPTLIFMDLRAMLTRSFFIVDVLKVVEYTPVE